MTRQPHPDERHDLDLPDRLRRALAVLEPRSVQVPPATDEAILDAARAHLRTAAGPGKAMTRGAWRRAGTFLAGIDDRLRGVWRPALSWGIGIAVLGILAGLAVLRYGADGSVQAGDLNRDGRVDILDALTLARRVELNLPLDRKWDLNGDGIVDRRDADVIAARSVRLAEEEERS